MLQVAVWAKGKAPGLAPLGIKLNQIKSNLLNAALRFAFCILPGRRSQLAQIRLRTLLGRIGRNLVQAVNTHIKHVGIPVHQLNRLLLHAAHINLLEAAEPADAMVDVRHIITHLKRIQVLKRQCLGLLVLVANREPLVALKKIMVHVGDQASNRVLPSAVQRPVDPMNNQLLPLGLKVIQNSLKALALALLAAHNPELPLGLPMAVERSGQKIKILGKCRLRSGLQRTRVRKLAVNSQHSALEFALPFCPPQIELMRLKTAHHRL